MPADNNGGQHDSEGVRKVPGVTRLDTGHLVRLHTTLETKSQDTIIDVYVTVVPVKMASRALKAIRSILPNDNGLDLHHLRRFAKLEEVPEPVQTSISASRISLSQPQEIEGSNELFMLLGSTYSKSLQDLSETLSSLLSPVPICSIPVPLLAPTSQEQAKLWTSRYWPTIYQKNNPFGPHPSLVSRAELEIRGDVKIWMHLATKVAHSSSAAGRGEAIGVVIVERCNGIARPIAIAGDARWLNWQHKGLGNATAHATLRAIAMVAERLKFKERAERSGLTGAIMSEEFSIFQDQPLDAAEQVQCHSSSEGYLCHEFEIYCSHEPCVMCSMAILHSRFSKVVFQTKMSATGGLCADGELGHGLFWRKELNWTLFAWQWIAAQDHAPSTDPNKYLHA